MYVFKGWSFSKLVPTEARVPPAPAHEGAHFPRLYKNRLMLQTLDFLLIG